uniref:Nuclear receptor domain-containing protein n=1 Tax=Panagrellus redivivus TaxID=6233 RepID=A0A7E4US51_PANRE
MYYSALLKNRTLEEVYHRELNEIENITFDCSLVISVPMVIFTIYVISTKMPAIISIPDPFEAQRKFVEDFPALVILTHKYPYLSGYHPDLPVCHPIKTLVNFGLAACVLFPIGAVLAVIVFVRRMKMLKLKESKKTYDMHFMLLKRVTKCAKRQTTIMQNACVICGEPAKGYNFGVLSCPACCAFFRRTVRLNRNYLCVRGGQCVIGPHGHIKCSSCRFKKCNAMGMKANAVQWFRDAIGKTTSAPGESSDTDSQTSSCNDKPMVTKVSFMPPAILLGILKDTYSTLTYRRKLFYAKSNHLSVFGDDKMEFCELEHYADGILPLYYTEPRFCSAIVNDSIQLLSISKDDKREVFASFVSHFQALEDLYLSWNFNASKGSQCWVLPNKQVMNLLKMDVYFIDKTGCSSEACSKNETALKVYSQRSTYLIDVIKSYFTIVKPSHDDFIFLFGLLLYDPTILDITDDTRQVLQSLRDQLIKEFLNSCKAKGGEPEIRLADVLLLMTGIKYYEKRLREDMLALRHFNVIPFDHLFDEIWVERKLKN